MIRNAAYLLLCLVLSYSLTAQTHVVTVSGLVKDAQGKPLAFVNVSVLAIRDSSTITGTITNEQGRFSINDIKTGSYLLAFSYTGLEKQVRSFLAGSLHTYLDIGTIEMKERTADLQNVTVSAVNETGGTKMDKRSYTVSDNITQSGGSVLQAMSNLPGVSVEQGGKISLRGSDKITVLVDGKQTALTGFGSQTGLDNIPASSIERIEIINNPSVKYDANGNAGIINIIYKKNRQQGWNGKAAITLGAGALWQRKQSLPGIRSQYVRTPKINPSLSLNYRKNKTNVYAQADWLYTETLNRNDFSERIYTTGEVVRQQLQRNRNTSYATLRAGVDHTIDAQNTITVSGLFNREKIIDNGDNPYYNKDLSQRFRLWQFLEDEVKYTATAMAAWQHKFEQPGHTMNVGFNYTFHREDEKYFFTNITPAFTGKDAFKLLSDEHVYDLNVDYVRPLKQGRIEGGFKMRRRVIPINMQFFPGIQSVIDSAAGGEAAYKETIPALYANYIFENERFETEFGLRIEHVRLNYDVNPGHNTYKSDGYAYTQPFFNVRLAYKLNAANKLTAFYNRRVDRPNEVDIRIFPKYDEPELIKVGNPALKPQFTNSFELGYRYGNNQSSLYVALYHRITDGTIVRIATQAPGSTLLYHVFQNAGRSFNTGTEISWQYKLSSLVAFNSSANIYRNTIRSFTVTNKYPVPVIYSSDEQQMISGNVKLGTILNLPAKTDIQFSMIYLAPDIIPQGRINSRFSADLGIKKQLQKGKGELFLNATDLFNTMRIKRTINGTGFFYSSTDYYETQVVRIGYGLKF
jgi:outer membrane receptor protein involved in Fe transport